MQHEVYTVEIEDPNTWVARELTGGNGGQHSTGEAEEVLQMVQSVEGIAAQAEHRLS